jgi:cardiolipin synthase (CMP-forming)
MTLMRHIPNAITLLRLVLVVPTAYGILLHWYGTALVLFLVAALSDAIDGFLAKRFGWITSVGGVLDPIADKLLLVSCIFALTLQGLLPHWLMWLIVGRDVVIVAGAWVYHAWIARFDATPSLFSKLTTLAQILLVLGMLWAQYVHQFDEMAWMVDITAGVTLLSGIHYVITWGVRAWRVTHWRVS